MPAPAHTPIVLLKAGGSAVFSARCAQLLQDVGFQPEDFGSYTQLSQQKKDERRLARRLARSLRRRQRAQGGLSLEDQGRLLQAEARSSTEVAHLGQNGVRQRQRGNPCSNLVDGFSEGDFPCVRIGGPAMIPDPSNPRNGLVVNPRSEHGRNTQREIDDARRAGRPDPSAGGARPSPRRDASAMVDVGAGRRADGRRAPEGSRYPAEDYDRDERARCADLCRERARRSPGSRAPDPGAMPPEPSLRQQRSLAAYERALANREEGVEQEPVEIDGQSAAECIDTFRKMGVAAMNQKAIDEIDDNAKAASTQAVRDAAARQAGQLTHREQRLAARAARARRERGAALNSVAGLERSPRRNPSHPQHAAWQQDRADASTRLRTAQAERQRAERLHARARREAQTARRRSSTLQNARCRELQGRRLARGEGRTEGRVPYRNED